ncbi:hypothetical protein GE09DRAFT_176193 [Coniochaeta sp. 2T2.1]|nr:hypothetical protein GE09DRAFT_176193 [Coniochaeta sp. 2T2.1]
MPLRRRVEAKRPCLRKYQTHRWASCLLSVPAGRKIAGVSYEDVRHRSRLRSSSLRLCGLDLRLHALSALLVSRLYMLGRHYIRFRPLTLFLFGADIALQAPRRTQLNREPFAVSIIVSRVSCDTRGRVISYGHRIRASSHMKSARWTYLRNVGCSLRRHTAASWAGFCEV